MAGFAHHFLLDPLFAQPFLGAEGEDRWLRVPATNFQTARKGPPSGEISFSRNIQDFDLGVTQLLCLCLEAETVSTRHMRQGFDRLQ